MPRLTNFRVAKEWLGSPNLSDESAQTGLAAAARASPAVTAQAEAAQAEAGSQPHGCVPQPGENSSPALSVYTGASP